MEELHHTHKEVPFGYWVLWVQPAFNALARKRRERRDRARARSPEESASTRWRQMRWG